MYGEVKTLGNGEAEPIRSATVSTARLSIKYPKPDRPK